MSSKKKPAAKKPTAEKTAAAIIKAAPAGTFTARYKPSADEARRIAEKAREAAERK